MSNEELRKVAWQRIWKEKWFGRLFGGGLLLGFCGYLVQGVISSVLAGLGVLSWIDFAQLVVQNREDQVTPIPNLTETFVSQATSSTALTFFFSWLMSAIAAYGAAVILRKCLANDERNWLSEAFGGFKAPFGMLWLYVRCVLIFLGWSIVALGVPGFFTGIFWLPAMTLPVGALSVAVGIGIALALCWAIWIFCIPFYRYRFVWLVKADHPDWGAGACLRTCRNLMRGNLVKSFRLDCSYWKPITLLLLLVLAVDAGVALAFFGPLSGVIRTVLGFAAFVGVLAALCCSVVLVQYIRVGQGLLYRELADAPRD